MATTIDWENKIISVPRADMLLVQSVPTEIRQLDLDLFRLDLKALEASDEGMPFLDTHSHNTTVNVGGVTLARVIQIINGYSITFEDGQYAVNLIGANSNVSDVVNVNQVSVRSANSAGLTYSEEIKLQSYSDASVWYDSDNGLAGTLYPRGTPTDPVNNIVDARVIMGNLGFDRLHVEGDINITGGAGQQLTDMVILGNSPLHTEITSSYTGALFGKITAHNLEIKGTFLPSGNSNFDSCEIGNFTGFRGYMTHCRLGGNIILDSSYDYIASFNFCSSHVPGNSSPTIDFNHSPCDGEFRHYAGGMLIKNFTQGKSISCDMVAGHVRVDASCTSGYILIRGNCKVTNLASGNAGLTVNVDHATNVQIEGIDKMTSLIPATL